MIYTINPVVGLARNERRRWNMDFFQNVFRAFSGRKNELEKPVFAKKYVDKSDDLLALAARLDAAPESMRAVYREALDSLGERIKTHRRVCDILEGCELPIVILHDLHILSGPGAAAIDYVILSNRYILTVSCPSSTDLPMMEKERKQAGSDVCLRLTPAENNAYVVKELLRDSRLLNKKELKLVWPVTVLSGLDKEMTGAASCERVPEMEPEEMNREQIVAADTFSEFLKNSFKLDDSMTFISNDKVFSIAGLLMEYEENSSCGSDNKN